MTTDTTLSICNAAEMDENSGIPIVRCDSADALDIALKNSEIAYGDYQGPGWYTPIVHEDTDEVTLVRVDRAITAVIRRATRYMRIAETLSKLSGDPSMNV